MTDEPLITFKVAQGKIIHPISLPSSSTVAQLKEQITTLTEITASLQKYLLPLTLQINLQGRYSKRRHKDPPRIQDQRKEFDYARGRVRFRHYGSTNRY
jgi:hypothetical protein